MKGRRRKNKEKYVMQVKYKAQFAKEGWLSHAKVSRVKWS